MQTKIKISTQTLIIKVLSLAMSAVMTLSLIPITAFAENNSTEVTGKKYEFNDKSSKYVYSEADTQMSTSENDTYGTFKISGNFTSSSEKGGVTAYKVKEGALDIIYEYNDDLLNADIDSWHLLDDSTNNINGEKLNSKIQNGAILVYTSIDRVNWSKAVNITNAFYEKPINYDAIYTTEDVELINGCYYKVVVAYEMRIRTKDNKVLPDTFEYKKCAEAYEFYAFAESGETQVTDYAQTYNIGSKVRTEFGDYSGKIDLKKDDPHYGWDIGNFFISGYTDKRVNDDGSVVFLKNPGDKITLWFRLKQDIDRLNGNEDLSITADTEGADAYFEEKGIDFGKGALFIRYTDYNNKSEPQIYTNYLEANTSIGADTKVQLFEEGDYEVALDYEITKNAIIDQKSHYRISFNYSVRNGNCMVYPFDLATGSELTNSSMTKNGFRLDLARSRYLQINVKREIMNDSADGLVEDIRFNGPAKDGAEYSEDGIYTITVSNQYTSQPTVKKIYVGDNDILRAYMATGLTIPEIKKLIADGATINADGTIKLAEKVTTPPETENVTEPETSTESVKTLTEAVEADVEVELPEEDNNAAQPSVALFAVIAVAIIAVAAVIVVVKNKKSSQKTNENKLDDNGGDTE